MIERVLILTPFSTAPVYGGSLVRIEQMVRQLGRRYEVWLGCRGGSQSEGLPCRLVPGRVQKFLHLLDPGFLLRLAALVRRHRIERILACTWLTVHQALLVRALTGVPVIVDSHNVEWQRLRRDGSPWWPWARRLEGWWLRSADQVWCTSQADARTLEQHFAVVAQVFPNGYPAPTAACSSPEQLRRQLGLHPTRPLVLFFGVLHYPPNARAVARLRTTLRPAWPAECQLVIAGLGGQPCGGPDASVVVTGFVEDLVGLIRASQVVVVPLESGSGTRLKILEALALGRRVVSTSLGAEGLDGLGWPQLLIEDDWEGFSHAVTQALSLDPEIEPLPALERYRWDRIFRDCRL